MLTKKGEVVAKAKLFVKAKLFAKAPAKAASQDTLAGMQARLDRLVRARNCRGGPQTGPSGIRNEASGISFYVHAALYIHVPSFKARQELLVDNVAAKRTNVDKERLGLVNTIQFQCIFQKGILAWMHSSKRRKSLSSTWPRAWRAFCTKWFFRGCVGVAGCG